MCLFVVEGKAGTHFRTQPAYGCELVGRMAVSARVRAGPRRERRARKSVLFQKTRTAWRECIVRGYALLFFLCGYMMKG
jgi:hypothetical protein